MTAEMLEQAVVQVSLDRLVEASRVLKAVLDKRPQAPMLACARVTGAPDGVTVEMFNLERGCRIVLHRPSVPFGPVLVGGTDLLAAVKGVSAGVTARVRRDGTASMSVSADRLTLTGPSGISVPMATVDGPGVWPELPTVTGNFWDLAGDDLASVVAAVTPAASKDWMVPVLCAVHVTTSGRDVHMEATDRFRAHAGTVRASAPACTDVNFQVRADTLAAVAKLLPAGHGVRLTVQKAQDEPRRSGWAVLSWQGIEVFLMLTEGQFPALARLWPADAPVELTCNRAALLGAVKSVTPFCVRGTPVLLVLDGAFIVASTRLGEGDPVRSAPVPVSGTPDDDVEFAHLPFTPGFLTDALAALDGDRVTLHVTHRHKPVAFDAGGAVSALVVPMRFFF